MLHCISGGKKDINLFIVLDAEFVCKVLKTKCHVSAKFNTDSAVSLSRISPTNNISGSCLIADLRAFSKDQVSCPISLCDTIHFFGSKTYSIGSSIVIKFSGLSPFISSSIATRDVDLPLPVGHVTKNNHFFLFKIFFLILSAMFVNIMSSSFLASLPIFLITTHILPVFKYAFTLYGVSSFDT